MYIWSGINEILGVQNPQLFMLPIVHLKDEIKPDHVSVTLLNLSHDVIQVAKHALVRSLKLYMDYPEI